MSNIQEIKNLSVKKCFSPKDSYYELTVDFSALKGEHNGTIAWIVERLQRLENGNIWAVTACRKGCPTRFELTIQSHESQLKITDDSEHYFACQSFMLDGFIDALTRLAQK
ncbi:MAG: hypothetical protein H0X02_12700 [Nitrosomonas sp.]|nr:hypothetical protein [Nitrosomonas sp.]